MIFMNQIISWLQNVLVRVTLTISLVGTALILSAVMGDVSLLQAQAKAITPEVNQYEVYKHEVTFRESDRAQAAPLTPEATKYKVNSQDSPFRENDQEKVNALFKENKNPQSASETTRELGEKLNQPQKTVKQNLENTADTLREKLNLDQPLYPGTKEVLNDAAKAIKGERD